MFKLLNEAVATELLNGKTMDLVGHLDGREIFTKNNKFYRFNLGRMMPISKAKLGIS